MKNIIISISLVLICLTGQSQVSGNINYQTQIKFPDQYINIPAPRNYNEISLSVKGMANVKADSYVAIFSLTQVGETTREVNKIMDNRVEQITKKINDEGEITSYLDMISFVPVYEYEEEKKIFSKNTYNEIPKGFELKKNIHIQYTDPEHLNIIISACAESEVYDLVRVDYFCKNQEQFKKDLAQKAQEKIQEKIKRYETLMGIKLTDYKRYLNEGFKIVYPVEMYKSYQAYSSSSLLNQKRGQVNRASKSTSLYYQPIVEKEFDFVMNSEIVEPVIQIMYEIKLNLYHQPEEKRQKEAQDKPQKEYFIVTPNGDIKSLPL